MKCAISQCIIVLKMGEDTYQSRKFSPISESMNSLGQLKIFHYLIFQIIISYRKYATNNQNFTLQD